MLPVVSVDDFPLYQFAHVPRQSRGPGNPKSKKKDKPKYRDIITAFDIETTRLPEIEQSFMYVWQWAFYQPAAVPPALPLRCVVVGRTWEEFQVLVTRLELALKKDRLVVWVHNLSFEFSFLRGIHAFSPQDVFAIKARKVLRADWGKLEFRCSYLHSNMSLDEYLDKMGVEHKKIQGFDYSKIRYSWTPLEPSELAYCIHDVVGLVEALAVEMAHDGDTLYTIPITSTGYVRRDAKRAMRQVSHSYVPDQLPDYPVYTLLREAFRGGDTHANRFYTGQLVFDGHSVDRSSSYPDIVCNCLFPVSEFFKLSGETSFEEVMELITKRRKAVVMRCAFTGLELREPDYPAPYFSRDKCRMIEGGEWDNGRILEAKYLETTITDVDLRIIAREYVWKSVRCWDVCYARYGKLPAALVEETIKYYRAKTELKGVPGQEVYYTKSKNKLNSIYGMMAQDPVKRSIIYIQEGKEDQYGRLDYYPEDDTQTGEELLTEHNKHAFLCYQWGCWVTAWARYRLREGIWTVLEQGGEFLYCDTDSVKYLGNISWDRYNAERVRASKASGAYATDPKGNTHYMGVFELEEDMLGFKTWGAKKYCYAHLTRAGEPELVSTIAGVSKNAGAEELCRHGGFDAFALGFTFVDAGGLEAVYNDTTDMIIAVEGHKLHITPNVTLRPSTYTMGLAADYERLLRGYHILSEP